MAATLLWQRDLASDASSVKTTLSSWDGCMSKTWCKWPVIAAIVVVSLIAFSLLTCLFRCLCCGVECCCGCLACCNACCPSPRRSRARDGYREQPPYFDSRRPPPFQPPPQQYQSSPAPVYGPNAPYPRNIPAKTATFVTSHSSAGGAKFNEDALPAMPSWNNAVSRRVEQEPDEEVELDQLSPNQTQKQSLIPAHQDPYYGQEKEQYAGDLNLHSPTSPYEHNPHLRDQQHSPFYDVPSQATLPDYHTVAAPLPSIHRPQTYSQPPHYATRPPLNPVHQSTDTGMDANQTYAHLPHDQGSSPASHQWNTVHGPPQQYGAYRQMQHDDHYSTSQVIAMPDGPTRSSVYHDTQAGPHAWDPR